MTLHQAIDAQVDQAQKRAYFIADLMALEYKDQIRAMAKAAQESINRSAGQHMRWQRAGIEQFKREHGPKAAPIRLSDIAFDALAYSMAVGING